jgi:hypothetical protein
MPGFSNIVRIFASDNNTAFVSLIDNELILYAYGHNLENKLGITDISKDQGIIVSPKMIFDEFDSPILDVQKDCFGYTYICILVFIYDTD